MAGVAFRRLLSAIPVLLIVSLISFGLMRLIPGDPAAAIAGVSATPAEIERLRRDLGLDQPVWMQLLDYYQGLARGDLGKSLLLGQVMTHLLAREHRVVIASLEMRLTETLRRMINQAAGCHASADFCKHFCAWADGRLWLYDELDTVASDRLIAMWQQLLAEHGGPLLFGRFSVADAFYAPVVMRLKTYALPVPPEVAAYMEHLCALPGVKAWVDAALAEQDFRDFEEPYRLSAAR